MLRTLLFGAILGIFVMLTGCQTEDEREAGQRRREAEAEQTLEDLFSGLAEALEEASQSDMSPIGKVVRQAENLSTKKAWFESRKQDIFKISTFL